MVSSRSGRQLVGKRIYAGYLAVQAVLGIVWWITLAASPTARGAIELMPSRHAVTDAFVFADIGVVVIGSALSAWGIEKEAAWSVPVLAFTTGGIVYPTLYLLGWASFTGHSSPLLAAMVAVSTLTAWCCYQLWRGRRSLSGWT